jgi:hypothetical protein
MRIDVPNTIMRTFEVQSLVQQAAFQGELTKQSTALVMKDEMQRSHTRVQAAEASHQAVNHQALDPDRDPNEAEHQKHSPPMRHKPKQSQDPLQESAPPKGRVDFLA